jgi:hypothetical protein
MRACMSASSVSDRDLTSAPVVCSVDKACHGCIVGRLIPPLIDTRTTLSRGLFRPAEEYSALIWTVTRIQSWAGHQNTDMILTWKCVCVLLGVISPSLNDHNSCIYRHIFASVQTCRSSQDYQSKPVYVSNSRHLRKSTVCPYSTHNMVILFWTKFGELKLENIIGVAFYFAFAYWVQTWTMCYLSELTITNSIHDPWKRILTQYDLNVDPLMGK